MTPATKSDHSPKGRPNMYSLAIKSLPRKRSCQFHPRREQEASVYAKARNRTVAPRVHSHVCLVHERLLAHSLRVEESAFRCHRRGFSVSDTLFFSSGGTGLSSFLVMIAVGVSGAGTEAFLNSYVKSMTYQTDDILGIPCWLFWVYTLNFATYGQLTRFLLEPKHTKKVFVGVEDLPHLWARKFYANHVGLSPATKIG